jgi:hypothetical protein
MGPVAAPDSCPDIKEVERITGLADSVIRNLQITDCYYRLSAAFAARTGPCANWCTFAVWASRQAGQTIRGEDFQQRLARELKAGAVLLHPVRSLWRWFLRRGVFRPETRLGAVVREIHSPFDAFERASDAVARGNRKVFEEIGWEFARYQHTCPADAGPDSEQFQGFLRGLRTGGPPEGQGLLRRAFTRYQQQRFETDGRTRAQLIFLANLEIGFHEQTRLQPEIREALEAPATTGEDLGTRALAVLFPTSVRWRAVARRPLIALLDRVGERFWRFAAEVTRRVITEHLMVLALPGGLSLALRRHLDVPFPQTVLKIDNPDLAHMLAQFEPAPPAIDDCGAKDWSDLGQRMHYAAHLFRAFHEHGELLQAPFTPEQVQRIRAGVLPEGDL